MICHVFLLYRMYRKKERSRSPLEMCVEFFKSGNRDLTAMDTVEVTYVNDYKGRTFNYFIMNLPLNNTCDIVS